MSRTWKQAGGSDRDWQRTRIAVLNRDGWQCQLKMEKCTRRATHVHHTVGREVSGDDPSALIASCQWCNLHVGDPRKHDPPSRRPQWMWANNGGPVNPVELDELA
jgi:5-methylcytosine-specific restriction endonuclease McrA